MLAVSGGAFFTIPMDNRAYDKPSDCPRKIKTLGKKPRKAAEKVLNQFMLTAGGRFLTMNVVIEMF